MAYTPTRRQLLRAGGATAGTLALGRRRLAAAQSTVDPDVLIYPDDPLYADLRHGFNLRWIGSPAFIALCHDSAQVAQTVQHALDNGLRITVRSGGHCYEDFSSGNDGGVIIDISPMASVSHDAETGMYAVEAGARLLQVYTALDEQFGVTLPGGSCSTVGAGGHITGGGYGLLSRLHGLTVDYLHGVEVVHVTNDGRAEIVTVTRDSMDADEQDLLWGHQGGGGGNFGVVTKFLLADLPEAPAEAHLMFHGYDWSTLDQASFRRFLQNYGNFLAEHSGVDSPYKGLFPLLGLNQLASGHIGLTAQYVGDQPELLAEFARAVSDGLPSPTARRIMVGHHRIVSQSPEIQSMSWLTATRQMSGTGPSRRGKYKSAYMIEPFPDEQIDVIWEFLVNPAVPNPSSLLQVDGYGCQVNAIDPAATAVPQRSSIMKLQYQAYWTDAADDDVNLEWIRSFYTAMYGEQGPMPDSVMDGCYVNYPDVDLIDWPTLYYKGNYARLQRVKARWDPLNIFNYQQSIRLPEDGATPTV
ncbi:MAG: FAD-binding oxidoreductase [Thermomicrobiales bacterium]|nr:FAD-binding oxidoreductase [Thermomicrobiales bacterium]